MSIIPVEIYEAIVQQRDRQPADEIARFTEKHTRGIAAGLGGIGGIRVIAAFDGQVFRRGGVQPPFALLSIPSPWIAVMLSRTMHQEQVHDEMKCRWALYPAGEPTETIRRMAGPEREPLLEPYEHLWSLEPIPEDFSYAGAVDWLSRAHEDCGRFEVRAAEMREAAEAALAELREEGSDECAEDLTRPAFSEPWERVLLPPGARLAALITPRDLEMLSEGRRRFLMDADQFRRRALVPFTILEPLILAYTSGRHTGLKACRCKVPLLGTEPDTINQVYTQLVEALQPTRRSKVGNVFREVVVMLHGEWTPLEKLRKEVEAKVAAGR